MISCYGSRVLGAVDAVGLDLTERDMWKPDWHEREESDLWINLAACILGSQVRSEDAADAARLLSNLGLLVAADRDWDRYETEVRMAISGHTADSDGNSVRGLRFNATKARHIRGAAMWIVSMGGSIRSILEQLDSANSARIELARSIPGFGYKQTSLYLRNIGFASGLAILDSHVLRFMRLSELTSQVTAPTPAQYLKFESILVEFAASRQMPMHIFDVAVWVVMRVMTEERAFIGATA